MMNVFLYLDRNTWIHRLDPRTKILGSLILSSLCLCFNHPLYVATISMGVLLLALSSKSLRNFWRFRFLLLLLFLFSSVLWPFFVKGPTLLWKWRAIQITMESLLYGVAMGLRLSTFVLIGLIFLSTTRNEEMTHGLIRLGVPYAIAFALSSAMRLVPTFVGAGATIVQAQTSRGLDLESGSLFSRLSKYIPQAVPLFIYAIRYTNHLAMALESKGFNPQGKRTFYVELQMKRADYIALLLLLASLGLALSVRIGWQLGTIFPGRI